MIYNKFKISATSEALLDVNEQMRVQLKNDHVQGIDTKRDEVLLSVTEFPEEGILEILCKKKLQNSEELKPLMALYCKVIPSRTATFMFFATSFIWVFTWN